MSGANRRRNPRVRAQGLASYIQSAGAAAQLPCFVEDISTGGLLVRTDRMLDMGTDVSLTLVRSGMKKAVQLAGSVVGHRPGDGARVAPGLRIAFRPLPAEVAARLDQMLKEFAKDGVPAGLQPVVVQPQVDANAELDRLRGALDQAQQALRERGDRVGQLERQVDAARRMLEERDAQIRVLTARLAAVAPPADRLKR